MTPSRKEIEEAVKIYDAICPTLGEHTIKNIDVLLAVAQQVLENGVGLSEEKIIQILDKPSMRIFRHQLSIKEIATAIHEAQVKGVRV